MASKKKLSNSIRRSRYPSMRIIRDVILAEGSPAPVVVSEGSNTMDVGRVVLVQSEPRTRLDARTWGTMGVGLGYCIAAAVASPERLVVAVEGDLGFGFNAVEVEVIAAAQTGRHNERRESYGDSLVIYPWGTIIARIPVGQRYLIEQPLGTCGYATVYKAYNVDSPSNVCTLKVEGKKPFAPFRGPWEFYMYCQLHSRIPSNESSSFAAAHELHVYTDCTILVTDYVSQGSFWEVIESYYQEDKVMPELVCMYYPIEMLHILEVLHDARILHGDFKSDNLLVRYASILC